LQIVTTKDHSATGVFGNIAIKKAGYPASFD